MTENEFWNLIENAWDATPDLKKMRMDIAIEGHKSPNELAFELESALNLTVYPKILQILQNLPKQGFYSFTQLLKQKLNELNREDIHEYTDGGDDGFLYCRGFIIGMGKEYFERISKCPSMATFDLESMYISCTISCMYSQQYED